uniref:SANTA domain-containing protein n=1 Tax=Spongospora subterranea TaxID=70186 RepID=A0A0H5QKH0_9EUKA|eukprot:CRZ01781.1 hypothetical protein [Spongospora subterranea]
MAASNPSPGSLPNSSEQLCKPWAQRAPFSIAATARQHVDARLDLLRRESPTPKMLLSRIAAASPSPNTNSSFFSTFASPSSSLAASKSLQSPFQFSRPAAPRPRLPQNLFDSSPAKSGSEINSVPQSSSAHSIPVPNPHQTTSSPALVGTVRLSNGVGTFSSTTTRPITDVPKNHHSASSSKPANTALPTTSHSEIIHVDGNVASRATKANFASERGQCSLPLDIKPSFSPKSISSAITSAPNSLSVLEQESNDVKLPANTVPQITSQHVSNAHYSNHIPPTLPSSPLNPIPPTSSRPSVRPGSSPQRALSGGRCLVDDGIAPRVLDNSSNHRKGISRDSTSSGMSAVVRACQPSPMMSAAGNESSSFHSLLNALRPKSKLQQTLLFTPKKLSQETAKTSEASFLTQNSGVSVPENISIDPTLQALKDRVASGAAIISSDEAQDDSSATSVPLEVPFTNSFVGDVHDLPTIATTNTSKTVENVEAGMTDESSLIGNSDINGAKDFPIDLQASEEFAASRLLIGSADEAGEGAAAIQVSFDGGFAVSYDEDLHDLPMITTTNISETSDRLKVPCPRTSPVPPSLPLSAPVNVIRNAFEVPEPATTLSQSEIDQNGPEMESSLPMNDHDYVFNPEFNDVAERLPGGNRASFPNNVLSPIRSDASVSTSPSITHPVSNRPSSPINLISPIRPETSVSASPLPVCNRSSFSSNLLSPSRPSASVAASSSRPVLSRASPPKNPLSRHATVSSSPSSPLPAFDRAGFSSMLLHSDPRSNRPTPTVSASPSFLARREQIYKKSESLRTTALPAVVLQRADPRGLVDMCPIDANVLSSSNQRAACSPSPKVCPRIASSTVKTENKLPILESNGISLSLSTPPSPLGIYLNSRKVPLDIIFPLDTPVPPQFTPQEAAESSPAVIDTHSYNVPVDRHNSGSESGVNPPVPHISSHELKGASQSPKTIAPSKTVQRRETDGSISCEKKTSSLKVGDDQALSSPPTHQSHDDDIGPVNDCERNVLASNKKALSPQKCKKLFSERMPKANSGGSGVSPRRTITPSVIKRRSSSEKGRSVPVSNHLQCVCLENWSLRLKGDFVLISGINSATKSKMEFRVLQRLEPTVIAVAADKKVSLLNLNEALMAKRFGEDAIKTFRNGFPVNWENAVKKADRNQTVKAKQDSMAPRKGGENDIATKKRDGTPTETVVELPLEMATGLRTSRYSGRRCVQPLKYWLTERIIAESSTLCTISSTELPVLSSKKRRRSEAFEPKIALEKSVRKKASRSR